MDASSRPPPQATASNQCSVSRDMDKRAGLIPRAALWWAPPRHTHPQEEEEKASIHPTPVFVGWWTGAPRKELFAPSATELNRRNISSFTPARAGCSPSTPTTSGVASAAHKKKHATRKGPWSSNPVWFSPSLSSHPTGAGPTFADTSATTAAAQARFVCSLGS